MYYHDLEVIGLNPGRVELGVPSTFIKVILEQEYAYCEGSGQWIEYKSSHFRLLVKISYSQS